MSRYKSSPNYLEPTRYTPYIILGETEDQDKPGMDEAADGLYVTLSDYNQIAADRAYFLEQKRREQEKVGAFIVALTKAEQRIKDLEERLLVLTKFTYEGGYTPPYTPYESKCESLSVTD